MSSRYLIRNTSWSLRTRTRITQSFIRTISNHSVTSHSVPLEAPHPEPSDPIDIHSLIRDDLSYLSKNIKSILTSNQPEVTTLAQYYFNKEGKHLRPLLVLLVSQATSLVSHPDGQRVAQLPLTDINEPLVPLFGEEGKLRKDNFALFDVPPSNEIHSPTKDGCIILPSQRRLAEITEMIHTASLFHDDVIDMADVRRGQPSVNVRFSSKSAVLGGDYLLARASVALARLRHNEAVELMATSIANLVEGELLQIKSGSPSSFDSYLEKSYLKTASLIANSCKAAALLGGAPQAVAQLAFDFGKNIGIAFQLIDDRLDFTSSVDAFGKPVGADLSLGLSTAPVLFARSQFPELEPLIKRKFSQVGDVQKAHSLVLQSDGLTQTLNLAKDYSELAAQSALRLPPSSSRAALLQLCQQLIDRQS